MVQRDFSGSGVVIVCAAVFVPQRSSGGCEAELSNINNKDFGYDQ